MDNSSNPIRLEDNWRCPSCDYESCKRFNVIRHMVRNHQINISQFHSIDGKNNTLPSQFHSIPSQNHSIPSQFHSIPSQNHSIPSELEDLEKEDHFKCESCYKCFKSKFSLTRHTYKCKKICHKNECPKCHVCFSCQSSKSRHMQKCSFEDQEPPCNVENTSTAATTNNITINNNQIADKIENNTVNNTNIIVFPIDGHTINFLTDHITNKDMRAALKCGDPLQGLQNYIEILFRREENRCISKTDMKSPYCRIHKGNNKWHVAVDDSVFPKFTTNTSEMALEHIENNPNIKIPKHTLDLIAKEYNRIVSQENPSFKAANKRVKACLYNFRTKV